MNIKNNAYLICAFIFLPFLPSCDSSKKELEMKIDETRNEQRTNYKELVSKYSSKILDNESILSKFSYELEEEYLHENLSSVASIFDIKKRKTDEYILFARTNNLSLELKINKQLLDKILKYRSELSENDKDLFKWYGLSETPFVFIIKPYAISKRYDLYKSISDYEYDTLYEEVDEYGRTEEVGIDLYDYTVDLELVNGGFYIKAECIDLTLADEIYWDLEEIN